MRRSRLFDIDHCGTPPCPTDLFLCTPISRDGRAFLTSPSGLVMERYRRAVNAPIAVRLSSWLLLD